MHVQFDGCRMSGYFMIALQQHPDVNLPNPPQGCCHDCSISACGISVQAQQALKLVF